MADLVGKTFGKQYFLRSLIGSGATADVYLAWDTVRATPMALKVLRQDLSQNTKFFKLFASEAEYYRQLEHPGIVRLYEFNKDGEYTYIVMDYVEGLNLHQLIQKNKKPLSYGETSNILTAVCPALHYAHQKGIYHCDIKPANMLVHSDGRVKLTDFGVAQFSQQPGMGGTPPYMAPEQFSGERIDARTDTYALGISLYEILSGGQVPYRGTSRSVKGTTLRDRIAWEHLNLELPSIREYVPNIKPSVEKVLVKAMEKTPGDRYQSAVELLSDFESAHSDPKNWETVIQLDQPRVKPMEKPVLPNYNIIQNLKVKGPHLFVRQGDMVNQTLAIPREGLVIGRGKNCNLQIGEMSVSRLHASIIIARNGIFIRDENSSLGTFINGQPIGIPRKLEDGDVITIGYYQIFEFRSG